MQLETMRQTAAWLTMVGLIMVTGLRAHADDSGKSGAADSDSSVEVREITIQKSADATGATLQDRLIVVGFDPEASPDEADGAIRFTDDDAAASGGGETRAARILRIDAVPAGEALAVRLDGQPEVEQLGKYWIGVQINDVSPALRAQLNLDEGRGVLIGEVLPESPASKAGVKQYDILLAIGDRKVGRNEDVLKSIKDADGQELKLTLLRGGSERGLTLAPAERPQRNVAARPSKGSQEAAARWLNSIDAFQQTVPDDWMQFNVVRPGQALVFPGGDWQIALPMAELPENLSISVTREGKKPAQITIKQDEREIETTEDKLNELPEEFRRYVEPMLGRARGAWRRQAKLKTDVLIPAPPGQESSRKRVRALPPGKGPEGVERRLEELERRFKELESSLDDRDSDGAKGGDSR